MEQQHGLSPTGSPSPQFQYQRRARDRGWSWAFLGLVVIVIAGGILATLRRNPNYRAGPASATAADCPAPGSHGRRLLMQLQSASDAARGLALGAFLLWVLVAVAIETVFASLQAVLLGAAMLLLARLQAQYMARAAFAITVLGVVLGWALLPFPLPRWLLLAAAAVVVVLFFWRQQEVELACHMLQVATHGLTSNPRLVLGAGVLSCVAALSGVVFVAPVLVNWHHAASQVGNWVPNARLEPGAACGGPSNPPCCLWRRSLWAWPYHALLWTATTWTLLLAFQLRAFVCGGTIAQWYFAGSQAGGAAVGAASRSLQHALGPSLGSLIFGAAILIPTRLLRLLPLRALSLGGLGPVGSTALVKFLLGTKFAVAQASISGEGLMEAGRSVGALLERNGLDLFVSPTWVASWVVALPFGALWVLWTAATERVFGTRGPHSVWEMGAVNLFVTYFLANMLLSALDASFVCWAIDRDVGGGAEAVKPEFEEAFQGLVLRRDSRGEWMEQGLSDEGTSSQAEVALLSGTSA